jgi:hypothetical protein
VEGNPSAALSPTKKTPAIARWGPRKERSCLPADFDAWRSHRLRRQDYFPLIGAIGPGLYRPCPFTPRETLFTNVPFDFPETLFVGDNPQARRMPKYEPLGWQMGEISFCRTCSRITFLRASRSLRRCYRGFTGSGHNQPMQRTAPAGTFL